MKANNRLAKVAEELKAGVDEHIDIAQYDYYAEAYSNISDACRDINASLTKIKKCRGCSPALVVRFSKLATEISEIISVPTLIEEIQLVG